MLVDSHCHLDFPDFADDLAGVLRRAKTAGVGGMQTICTRLTAFDGVQALAEAHDHIWCSVGVHPHHVADEPAFEAEHLIRLAAHPKVIGIGETGLDFHYERSPREAQAASFRRHVSAARETGLPLIVHTRSADDETNRILREEAEAGGPFRGVIHCFSVGRAVAETALELGLYISVSGIVTFKKASALRAIVRDMPPERLLVETDAPYLAPAPHRGKRNEPSYVAHTANAVAALIGLSEQAVADQTTENFFALFSKAERHSIEIE
jgi:TatD DNase family protein